MFSPRLTNALRLLTFLSQEDRKCKAVEICYELGFSTSTLEELSKALVACGFIETRKGPGGGHSLVKGVEHRTLGSLASCFGYETYGLHGYLLATPVLEVIETLETRSDK